MEHLIDARQKTCPIPVVMAKKEAESGETQFSILVDNPTAVENLKRFGANNNYKTVVRETGPDFEVAFSKAGNLCDSEVVSMRKSWAVFVGNDQIGHGDSELGRSLLKMFLYTLEQDDHIPGYLLFMNAGVKIPVEDEQIIEHLKALQEKGTQILVCGTCLGFYGISDQLKVGIVSNMYDIVDAMKTVDKVITI